MHQTWTVPPSMMARITSLVHSPCSKYGLSPKHDGPNHLGCTTMPAAVCGPAGTPGFSLHRSKCGLSSDSTALTTSDCAANVEYHSTRWPLSPRIATNGPFNRLSPAFPLRLHRVPGRHGAAGDTTALQLQPPWTVSWHVLVPTAATSPWTTPAAAVSANARARAAGKADRGAPQGRSRDGASAGALLLRFDPG